MLCSFDIKRFDLVICAVTGKQGKDFVAAFCNGIEPTVFHFFFFFFLAFCATSRIGV